MKTPDLTIAAILSPLDDCATVYPFPMFDNTYIFAAARRALYRDVSRSTPPRWALLIEAPGFSPTRKPPDNWRPGALCIYRSAPHAPARLAQEAIEGAPGTQMT